MTGAAENLTANYFVPRSFINSLVVLADFTIFLSQFNNVHDRAEFAAGQGGTQAEMHFTEC